MREASNESSSDVYNRQRYIVMELLRPVISNNFLISARSQQSLRAKSGTRRLVEKAEITNELGVFGVLVK